MSNFIKELDLEWDCDTLLKVMFSHPYSSWKAEGNIPNKYLRIDDPYINNIIGNIRNLGYDPRQSFFAEMLPNTQLPIHTDISRIGAINFPLLGDWSGSLLEFYDTDKQSLLYSYQYKDSQAVWINTEVFHTVKNTGNKRRFIFSVSLY